jgi:hypothetical protein
MASPTQLQTDISRLYSSIVVHAEALSRKQGNIGAIAFSRSGDPATGDFGDATIIRKLGEVPTDLSDL